MERIELQGRVELSTSLARGFEGFKREKASRERGFLLNADG
jgi:hypothetical protein